MVVRSHGEAAPPALTPLAGSAPTAAGPSPEQEQLAQLLRGFLGVMEQEIGELKTSIDQLKATQEQMARRIAKDSEQQLRPKTSAPPPRSIATSTPVPRLSSPQTRAQPLAPVRGRP